MMTIHQLAQHRSALARMLGAVAVLLLLAHIGGLLMRFWIGHDHVFGLVPLFNLGQEWNIPTLFATLLLLFAAFLLTFISVSEKRQGSRDVSKWAILAIGFLYMAIDEFGYIHELLIAPIQNLFGDRNLGIFYYAWVIPGAAVVIVLAVFFLGFLRRLPARTSRWFVVAATLFIGGALGVELPEGRHVELFGENNLTYMLYVTVEESLEMAGVIVFIWALLQYIADNHKELQHGPTMLMNNVPAKHP